ncbi:MAG: T9SS type A sorting domain-containing protein [Bacteroidales bacterium]|nr:T9SS type A sorting domain-containing protein [Bacteroidales bacterium]
MKRLFLTLSVLFLLQFSYAQKWYSIENNCNESYSTQLIQSTDESIVVDVSLNGFFTKEVKTSRAASVVVYNNDMAPLMEIGQPDVPSLSIPIIIDDFSKMAVRVTKLEYIDYHDVEIAPSRGDFPRSVNPDNVPYQYGEVYEQDAFFPSSNVKLDSPYIIRDFRAQNIILTPFSYNPITKTLRVYHKMRVEVFNTKGEAVNVKTRHSNNIVLDTEYKNMYASRFINYQASSSKYDVFEEEGDMIIICHDAFMEAMQPLVEWKRATGRNTTMVGTSVTGTDADGIKEYLLAQYESNPKLVHVLLVGDHAQLPGKYLNESGYDYDGYSDWWFGQLEGDDRYNELIVGRFSAETVEHVTTQVDKVIYYEKDMPSNSTWLKVGQGVSKRENSTGHNSEDDYQHIDNIREDLLNYNYTTVHRDYSNVTGVTSSAAIVSDHINSGVSIINYCNHGTPTSWGVFSYNNAKVNELTNDNKLPYIISVACNNGEYTYYSQPCFAETWMRATNESTGNPTGAIGGMFSYISQPWIPPMYAQDEMNDVLVESYSNNIKRTMGGVSLCGNMKMLDLGHNSLSYYGTYNTWHLFGDPSLTLRNNLPQSMNVSHSSEMSKYSTHFMVSATYGEGANATLTRNGELLGTAKITNGNAMITFEATMTEGEATLTVFGFNKKTYQATINIVENVDEDLFVIASADPTLVAAGTPVNLNADAFGGSYNYTYSWSPEEDLNDANIQSPIATPTETTTYTCVVNDGETTATASVTVTVITPPTNITATVEGNNVNLSWDGVCDGAFYKIYRNNILIVTNYYNTSFVDDDLDAGVYSYTIKTVYGSIESPKSNEVVATIYDLEVTAFANPGFIAEGDSASLIATATGCGGDLTFRWEPAEFVLDPNASTTKATPLETTTFTVTVTCGSQTATASTILKVLVHPENLTAEIDGNDVILNWESVEEADYYQVLRNGAVYCSFVEGTTYVDEDVEAGNYCYTVHSICNALQSYESNEACVEIESTCVPPKNLSAEYYWYDGEFGALIDWDKQESSVELTEFRIYRSFDNVDYKLIGNLVNVPSMTHYQYSDINNTEGTYYYKVSAYYANTDCESEFAIAENSNEDYVVLDVNSINENDFNKLRIYPNPVKNKLNIMANQIKSLSIVNMMGQSVLRQEVDVDEFVLDVSSLDSGMYLLNVETGNGVVTRQINIIK